MRSRVLVVAQDSVGPQMAGPAIRAFELSRSLGREHSVTLATLHPPAREGDGFEIVGYGGEAAALRRLVERHDVVLAFGSLLTDHPWLEQSDAVIVGDVYDPAPFEALVMHEREPLDQQVLKHDAALERFLRLLARADALLCASERQRHLLVGALAALGRVDPRMHAADPALAGFVRVVPFGLPREPPAPSEETRLRGNDPRFSDEDFVVLWGGGIYEWLDPLTLVEAVALIDDPTVKVLFMGSAHPTPEVPTMPVLDRLRARSEELGLLDHRVFLGEDWVPYEQRAGVLCDADVGVSLHHRHVEAAYAFRTRMLDYLWARLPIVCSEGDTLADLVAEHDLGAVVPIGDATAAARAIESLRDPDRREECAAHLATVAARFDWDTVCEPLVELCRAPRRAPDGGAKLPVRSRGLAARIRRVLGR